MSNTTDTQTSAPILTDAAVIELWAYEVRHCGMDRKEALAYLASIDLSVEALAERLRAFAPHTLAVGGGYITTMCDLEIERRIANGDSNALDSILEIKALAAALAKI